METVQIPASAKYYLPLLSDKKVATLFYRWWPIKYNDGTIVESLQYLSTCGGGWFGSAEKNPKQFIVEKLIPIGAQYYSPSEKLFYQWEFINWNDGTDTKTKRLCYFSNAGYIWQESTEKLPEQFVNDKLIPL